MARKKKPTPRTQECTVCGYPRKFLRMREKVGKDGRIARWPEYETCPNKNDPELHPSTKNESSLLDEILRKDPKLREVVEKVVEHKEMPVGILMQVQDNRNPLEGISDCLLFYEEKMGALPIAIGIREDEAGGYTEIDWETEDGKEVTIPIWPMVLSPKYGYIYLVKEVS